MLCGLESSSGAEVHIRKCGPSNMRAKKVRPGEARSGEVRPAKVCPAKGRPGEVCIDEARPTEVCSAEVRAVEVRLYAKVFGPPHIPGRHPLFQTYQIFLARHGSRLLCLAIRIKVNLPPSVIGQFRQ